MPPFALAALTILLQVPQMEDVKGWGRLRLGMGPIAAAKIYRVKPKGTVPTQYWMSDGPVTRNGRSYNVYLSFADKLSPENFVWRHSGDDFDSASTLERIEIGLLTNGSPEACADSQALHNAALETYGKPLGSMVIPQGWPHEVQTSWSFPSAKLMMIEVTAEIKHAGITQCTFQMIYSRRTDKF